MLKFIFKRILETIPVLFIVVTTTFFFIRMVPGGPFDAEKRVPPEIQKNLNKRYHLNDPVWTQYWDYVKHLAKGDFGPSFKYPNRSVTELIQTGLPITAELGLYALLISVFFGTLAGILAALKPNTIQDYLPMSFSLLGICVPSFLLGPLLVLIFSIWVEWLPVSGWEDWSSKILPSITLGAGYAAYVARLSRGGLLEVLYKNFIRTARAKGLPEWLVILKHALWGGLTPVIAFLGPATAGLLAGSFVVETIFQIPGMGRFYIQAAFNRDYTMILGTTILFSILIVLFNLFSDILLVWVNPRLSFQEKKHA